MLRASLTLLASLLLASAAEPPTRRSFLMLGGATQIVDADGKVVLSNYDARAPKPKLVEITRDKRVVWTYVDGTKFGVHEFQLLDAEGKPLVGVLR